MKYRVTHSYATLDDDGKMVVEVVDRSFGDFEDMRDTLHEELDNPGGRSGTTITLTVTALDDVRM